MRHVQRLARDPGLLQINQVHFLQKELAQLGYGRDTKARDPWRGSDYLCCLHLERFHSFLFLVSPEPLACTGRGPGAGEVKGSTGEEDARRENNVRTRLGGDVNMCKRRLARCMRRVCTQCFTGHSCLVPALRTTDYQLESLYLINTHDFIHNDMKTKALQPVGALLQLRHLF